jgi:hypothetical protein
MSTHGLRDPEGVFVHLMVLQMKLLLDINSQILAHSTMLSIQLVPGSDELVAEPRVVVILQFIQVDRIFHHARVRFELFSVFLPVYQDVGSFRQEQVDVREVI